MAAQPQLLTDIFQFSDEEALKDVLERPLDTMSPATRRIIFCWVVRNSSLSGLPSELLDYICEYITEMPAAGPVLPATPVDEPKGPRGDPNIPPADDSCPLLELPRELRRNIFAASLLSKHAIIRPQCDSASRRMRDTFEPPKRNSTSDLMVLNKQIKNEVALTVYEERVFEIHVHEGITGGGIEFLDAGRQQLQYLSEDYGIDTRFTRFKDGEQFGFDRLKKINIVIYSKSDPRPERHTAMNTYFANLALAHMLQRTSEKDCDRIISLSIYFYSTKPRSPSQQASGRRAIIQGDNECAWWDAEKQEPLSSEIHSMSDVELVLRPFSLLRRIHNVDINIPEKLKSNPKLTQFVRDLKQVMTGSSGKLAIEDGSFEVKANAIKHDLYQNHIYGGMFGKAQVPDLTADELQDHWWEGDGNGSPKKKPSHKLSPALRGDPKRLKGDWEDVLGIDDEDEDEDAMVRELMEREEREDRQEREWRKAREDKTMKHPASQVADLFAARARMHARNTQTEQASIQTYAEHHNRAQLPGLSSVPAPRSGWSPCGATQTETTSSSNFTGTGFSLQSAPTITPRIAVPTFASRRSQRSQDTYSGADQTPGYPPIGNLRMSSSGLSNMVPPTEPMEWDSRDVTQNGSSSNGNGNHGGPVPVACGVCRTPLPTAQAFFRHQKDCARF